MKLMWGLIVRMVISLVAALSVTVGYLFSIVFVTVSLTPIHLAVPETIFVGIVFACSVQLLGITYLRRKFSPRTKVTENSTKVELMVRRLAQQFDMPMPSVAVSNDPIPNARTFELPTQSPRIIVTTGLLDVLDDKEIEAVLAHELAHIRNRDSLVITVAAVGSVTAGSVASAMNFYVQKVDSPDTPWYLNPLGIVAGTIYVLSTAFWFMGRLCVSSLSRYREFVADDAAVKATGNPTAFASAIETLTGGVRTPQSDYRTRGFEPQEFDFLPLSEKWSDETESSQYELFAPIHPEEGDIWTATPYLRHLIETHPRTSRRLRRLQESMSET